VQDLETLTDLHLPGVPREIKQQLIASDYSLVQRGSAVEFRTFVKLLRGYARSRQLRTGVASLEALFRKLYKANLE